ncbi:MAG TPA: ABC transporter permease, partial [Kofleriaceae bacterium]|nr:ABC transporter permease [Kofleriaceae bacterium]
HSLESIGAKVLDAGCAMRGLWQVFTGTLAGVFRGGRPKGEVLKQMYLVGNRSLLFVGVTLGFIGMVMTYQTCLQINRVTGDLSQIGPEFIKILVHDLAPTLTAMMLATRVGAGIAAEVGSMKVTEQIDALRMSGVAPIDYLIVPRFMACLIMTVVLTTFGVVVAYVAGGMTAHYSFGLNPDAYYDLSRVKFTHLGLGLAKSISYGAAIPIISGFCGLRAKGSSEGVGWATTAAVIGSSFAVILIDFIISAFGFTVLGESMT